MNSFKHRWYGTKFEGMMLQTRGESILCLVLLEEPRGKESKICKKKLTVASTPGRFGTMHGMKTYFRYIRVSEFKTGPSLPILLRSNFLDNIKVGPFLPQFVSRNKPFSHWLS